MKSSQSCCYLLAAAVASLFLAGCNTCHQSEYGHDLKIDKCAEIPPGSLPDPPGEHVRRFQTVQRQNAISQEYVIFLHEWTMGGLQLGPYGEYHLHNIAVRLPKVAYPVVVEASPDPKANEFRRNLIVARLLEKGIHDADARVIVATPAAEGLFGDEAPRAFGRMLQGGGGAGGAGIPGGGAGLGAGFPGGGVGGAGTFLPPLVGPGAPGGF